MDFYGINTKANITASGTPDLGSSGNPFNDLFGCASSAEWGDLAEKYKCKGDFEKGSVMCVSKDPLFDLEECNEDLSTSYIGVVSTKPGFKMNNALKDGDFIGLTGLLPTRIVGPINKGDFIVATVSGCARAGKDHEVLHKIGVANETNTNEGIKTVVCIIK